LSIFRGRRGISFHSSIKTKKKKDAKKIQYWFARLFTISILGDCLFVILRAFIELEQALFRSVDEAALLNGKLELER